MLFFIGCHAGGIKNHPEKNSLWISRCYSRISWDPGNKSINQNNRMKKAAKIKKVHQNTHRF
jgi:hypothetical protein